MEADCRSFEAAGLLRPSRIFPIIPAQRTAGEVIRATAKRGELHDRKIVSKALATVS